MTVRTLENHAWQSEDRSSQLLAYVELNLLLSQSYAVIEDADLRESRRFGQTFWRFNPQDPVDTHDVNIQNMSNVCLNQ